MLTNIHCIDLQFIFFGRNLFKTYNLCKLTSLQ